MDSVWILTWNPSGFPVWDGLDTALLLCNEHDNCEMFQKQAIQKRQKPSSCHFLRDIFPSGHAANPEVTVFSTTLPWRFWIRCSFSFRLQLYGQSNCFLILHNMTTDLLHFRRKWINPRAVCMSSVCVAAGLHICCNEGTLWCCPRGLGICATSCECFSVSSSDDHLTWIAPSLKTWFVWWPYVFKPQSCL